MHSFSASSDLLISAPSNRLRRSLCVVSAPLSLPARSMKENFPAVSVRLLTGSTRRMSPPAPSDTACARLMARTAWLREESSFAPVEPVDRARFPVSMARRRASTEGTRCSERPMICTSPLHTARCSGEARWSVLLIYTQRVLHMYTAAQRRGGGAAQRDACSCDTNSAWRRHTSGDPRGSTFTIAHTRL